MQELQGLRQARLKYPATSLAPGQGPQCCAAQAAEQPNCAFMLSFPTIAYPRTVRKL